MGITRIHIKSDWGDREPRVAMSRDLEHSADNIYYEVFNNIGMQLDEGLEIIECTKDEAMARYDWREGIDVILNFANGHRATAQEKLLEYWESTNTFTEHQRNGTPGNWYTCTSQYWLTAYAEDYKNDHNNLNYRDWMLIDFPLLKRLDAMTDLPWHFKENNQDGYRGIGFRYIYFDDTPSECIVARMVKDEEQIRLW